MEQLPDEHRLCPGKSQVGRGLCGRDPFLRGQVHQVPQGGPLSLLRLFSGCFQGRKRQIILSPFLLESVAHMSYQMLPECRIWLPVERKNILNKVLFALKMQTSQSHQLTIGHFYRVQSIFLIDSHKI